MKVKLHQCEVEKLVNVKIDRNEISHVLVRHIFIQIVHTFSVKCSFLFSFNSHKYQLESYRK